MRAISQILSDSAADRVAAEGATSGTYEAIGHHGAAVIDATVDGEPWRIAETEESNRSHPNASNLARNASPTRVLQRAADIEGMAERIAALTADAERLAGALEAVRAWQRWCGQPALLTDRDREIVQGFRASLVTPSELTRDVISPALAAHEAVKP